MKSLYLTLLVAATLVAVSGTAHARPWHHPHITLYSAPNYGGASLTLTRSDPDLGRNKFNDRAQSARARGNWLLCRGRYYKQQCVSVRGDVPSLKALHMNRRAGSVMRR